jgi:two-component system sensor histidine kinase FlrB
MRNLIENAVRATVAGGEVEVAVERDGDRAVIRVADRGPGVVPELLGRILEPYFSTQSGGTGLGLPIARRVVEEHGGVLTVRNRPSGGFEVAVTIPTG